MRDEIGKTDHESAQKTAKRTAAAFDGYLVLLAQSGDADALAQLYRHHGARLQAFAMRQSGFERDLAQDASQEAWAAIARDIRRLKDPARFYSWAASIAANKVRDQIRRRVRAKEDPLSETQGLSIVVAEDDDVALLRRAIQLLSAKRRELLILFYYEGLSITEIAAVTGIAAGTVKSRLYHAREALKHILKRSSS